ncbi:hypothetical protein FOXG_19659 [Fusarium oxysporum f. sp. lycopersici 4287]|uniref:Zn(2)-C6 fungal-type domain-containing protein n=1 Tax=Fusarium oxysporum f. sp. lycopersici (strain 4287 / CBS 123668 / FGSC 9935 / NRRL 34936) TaxID=426428 RepID=A0A0J9V5G0_FUSO4|nr:hypothetical protein FOXG_19659 [Fusarium oxysporum f. sp. lycopersici 4287]KNB06398.1 hypothetical protein FOXG_19659 [Fusarium oxysporum f. sp. lycopersici 4287]
MEGSDRSKKRIANACLRCQRRKIRCDGEVPACTPCIEQNMQCDYAERRRRGPGKSKQYIHMLEERLSKVESSLEKSASAQPSEEWTAISRPPDVDTRGHFDKTGKHSASVPGGISTGPQGEATIVLGASSSIISTASTQRTSQAVLENLEAPTGNLESLDITNDIDGFRRQVFASVQSQFLLRHFITNALDDINDLYPVFTVESLSELLQQQFLAGPRNCDDSPSRWATTNALIATAIQWKIEHGAHDQLILIAWGYFKNAFAIFPELLIRGNDISTCQALLLMGVFMHGTADARTTSSITASLARALQAVGLHTRRWYEKLDRTTAEQHRRVFWIAYCTDSDQMMKQGLPSTFGNEVDLKLPDYGPPDGLSDYTLPGTQDKINVLRCMAGLAMIQSRTSTELYSQRALKMNNTQLYRAVAELNHQLDMWKMDLPPDIRPTYDSYSSSSQLEMPLLLLTIIYYTTAGRINMAINRLGHSNDDTVKLQAQVPIAAARATLRLIQKMAPPPFSLSWQIMYHAVYAVITLFTSILQSPSGSEVHLDLSLITGFVRAVEKHRVHHGCDLGNLLSGCTRIEEAARDVVNSRGATSEDQYLSTDTSPERLTEGKYLLTCQRLCGSVDHMQIVHGLMGNIPTLCSEAVEVFAEVLRIDRGWTHTYGLFVPESLKAENFNFRFGPP